MTLSEKIKSHMGKECWVIDDNGDFFHGNLVSYTEDIPEASYYLKIDINADGIYEIDMPHENVYFAIDEVIKAIDKRVDWHNIMVEALYKWRAELKQ